MHIKHVQASFFFHNSKNLCNIQSSSQFAGWSGCCLKWTLLGGFDGADRYSTIMLICSDNSSSSSSYNTLRANVTMAKRIWNNYDGIRFDRILHWLKLWGIDMASTQGSEPINNMRSYRAAKIFKLTSSCLASSTFTVANGRSCKQTINARS